MSLSYNTLRAANMKRLPQFKNAKGELAHSEPDGSDWSPAEWLQAVVGELGELANMLKKVKRGDYDFETGRAEIAKEFADVAIYLDLFAYQFRIDLGEAVREKFNEVSRRVDVPVFISRANVVCEHDPDLAGRGFEDIEPRDNIRDLREKVAQPKADPFATATEQFKTLVTSLPDKLSAETIDDIAFFLKKLSKGMKR